MLKKLICMMLVFSIISIFGMTVFAAPTDDTFTSYVAPQATPASTPQAEDEYSADDAAGILMNIPDDTETGQSLVEITRPDDDTDSTYKSSYVISGVSDYSDIIVVLQVYDEGSESYVPLKNTDGESSWRMGSFGVFSKEIELNEGANKIRILAYEMPQKGSLDIGRIQVNKFTVTLLKESIKNAFINSINDFTKVISELFNIKK